MQDLRKCFLHVVCKYLATLLLTKLSDQLLDRRFSPADIPGPEQEERVGEVSEQELDDGQANALVGSRDQDHLHVALY